MNSSNKQFINKKRNITREDEDETEENILKTNEDIKGQIEKLSQKQNLFLEEIQKERKEERKYILKLEQSIKIMQLNMDILKSEREKDIKNIDNLRKYTNELKDKIDEDRKYINQLLFQREEDKRKTDDLIFNKLKNEYYINELLMENKSLKDRMKRMEIKLCDLVNYQFEIKLRKLLKNLIGYILDTYYDDYMGYNEIKKKLYFRRSPKYIKGETVGTIIEALNYMLEILFYETKEGDYLVHFVNPNAKLGNRFHEQEELFKNSKDFFIHFGLSQYENILNQIIPEEYFTTIDNLDFKIKISDLIKKHKNKKNNKLSANNYYKKYFQ